MQELQEAAARDAAAKAELEKQGQLLRAHISDLETRKRAPLYQKKQEEELKVLLEHPVKHASTLPWCQQLHK